MRKKIPVEELRPGMQVVGLDESWFKTSLLKHSFTVKKHSQIKKLMKDGIKHVYVDTETQVEIDEVVDDIDLKAEEQAPQETEKQRAPSKITAEVVRKYIKQKGKLLQVDRSTLLKGSFIDFGLYIKDGLYIRPLARYKNKDIEVDDRILSAEGEMLIENSDAYRYKNYLNDLIRRESDGEHYREIKNKVIKESAKIHVKELLDAPRSGDKVKQCRGAVEDIISSLHDNKGLVTGLVTLNKHDYYTYTHSVEVSVLSVGMAIALGMDGDGELFSIGMGSILHDIGKSDISQDIINKPSRLTSWEFSVMKQHVPKGKALLDSYIDVPDTASDMVLQHHEKISGRGYPLGLKDGDIYVAGRVAAIADVYDAITTTRPYRKAMQPFEALKIIRDEEGNYDMEIFEVFVKMLGEYGMKN